ncbi:dihydrofolate reductase family protein [Neomicrococcus lactis]
MGKVVMNASVSLDGFIADANDGPGPPFECLLNGDVPLDDSGLLKVSRASFDHIRPYWDSIGVTIVGRHVFDLTDGWNGIPPSGIPHVIVVTHRPALANWNHDAPFHFISSIDAAMTKDRELARDRTIEVSAGDVGGQFFAAGLIDEVRMDLAPVVLGTGKRYFGSLDSPRILGEPGAVVQGNRVVHLVYPVSR